MFDKAIASGQERRRPWPSSKKVDSTCRNHGSCPWCLGNRLYRRHKEESIVRSEEQEYQKFGLMSECADGFEDWERAIMEDMREQARFCEVVERMK